MELLRNKFKIRILLLNILIFSSSTLYAQKINVVDDSINKLNDTLRLSTLVDLCWDYRLYEPIKSFEYGIEALILAETLGNNYEIVKLNNYLGLLYRNINAYDFALNYFNESYRIADSLNFKTEKAYALNNKGNVLYLQSKFKEALLYLHEAKSIFKSEKNLVGEAYCYNQIGLLYFTKKEYNNSIKNHLQALDIRKSIDNKKMISTSLFYIARTYLEFKQYKKAEKYLKERISYLENDKQENGLPTSYFYLAKIFQKQNNKEKALEYYQKSLDTAIKYSLFFPARNAANNLSDYYQQINDIKNSFKYFKIYKAMNDSTHQHGIKQQFLHLDTKKSFETRLNQMTNTIKHKEKIHQLEIEKQERVIIFFTTFFVIFVLFILFVYRSSKKIKIKNKALEEQKQNIIEINQEINIKNDELEEINNTKDKFFSIIAHDLKNPFNSMLGLSDLLIEDYDDLDTVEQKEMIVIINKELQKSYNLLENLLLWAREQRGVLRFNLKKENLHLLCNQTIEELSQQISNKSINLTNKIPENIFVNADKNMILIILRNLISNAIKFTEKNGRIEIGCENMLETRHALSQQNTLIEIYVKDTGVGITKEKQEELFDITKNTITKGTDNEAGTGLGLIICKEFIEKHGGKIRVESETGKGSIFWFSIPISKLD